MLFPAHRKIQLKNEGSFHLCSIHRCGESTKHPQVGSVEESQKSSLTLPPTSTSSCTSLRQDKVTLKLSRQSMNSGCAIHLSKIVVVTKITTATKKTIPPPWHTRPNGIIFQHHYSKNFKVNPMKFSKNSNGAHNQRIEPLPCPLPLDTHDPGGQHILHNSL